VEEPVGERRANAEPQSAPAGPRAAGALAEGRRLLQQRLGAFPSSSA
jgi:hypothetical protein